MYIAQGEIGRSGQQQQQPYERYVIRRKKHKKGRKKGISALYHSGVRPRSIRSVSFDPAIRAYVRTSIVRAIIDLEIKALKRVNLTLNRA